MSNVVKFERKAKPQDPWVDMLDEIARTQRTFIMVGFSLIAGLALGVVVALGNIK